MTFYQTRYFLKFIIICLSSILFLWTNINSKEVSEYEVKAALLLKFPAFVKWPSGTFSKKSDNFIICILGEDPFGNIFKSFMGEKIKNKKFIIKRVNDYKNIGNCHILFISASERKKIPIILNAVKNRHILVVGETKDFNKLGGTINLYYGKKGNIQFGINQEAGRCAGLIISSKLMGISRNN